MSDRTCRRLAPRLIRLRLRAAVAARGNGPTHVQVVATAQVTALRWLATDEDETRQRPEPAGV